MKSEGRYVRTSSRVNFMKNTKLVVPLSQKATACVDSAQSYDDNAYILFLL